MLSRLKRALRGFRHTPWHPQWLLPKRDGIASWVTLNCCGRVLDIGCADRWIERELVPGCEYIALDYPATGHDLYGARPDVFADARNLPFKDASIDNVLFLEVAEHLRHPRESLLEIARVLRPGGGLLMSIPFLYPIHDAPFDFQRYTRYGLEREIELAGLVLRSIECELGSAETAGLLGCLAISGMTVEAISRNHPGLLMTPLLLVLIPALNLMAWLAGRLLPTWPALSVGYRIHATRAIA